MTTIQQTAAPERGRMAFLDTLRGIAAFAVLVTHILERLAPDFERIRYSSFDLGSWGVVVFFLCSGFIIPVSLERHGSPGRFWVQRFFRLFPLYWLSLAGASAYYLLAPGLDRNPLAVDPLPTLLANLTMLQLFMGVPLLLRVYWTLGFELIFYLLVSLLFLLRVRPGLGTVLVTAALTAGLEIGLQLGLGLVVPPGFVGVYLIMFSGTLLFRWQAGDLPGWQALGGALLGLAVLCASALVNGLVSGAGLWGNLNMLTAWVLGYSCFLAALAWRDRAAMRAPGLQYLGRVSYSLYLLHPLVLMLIPATPWPPLTAAIWLGAALGLAALSFRWVERPTMEFGSRLARGIGAMRQRLAATD